MCHETVCVFSVCCFAFLHIHTIQISLRWISGEPLVLLCRAVTAISVRRAVKNYWRVESIFCWSLDVVLPGVCSAAALPSSVGWKRPMCNSLLLWAESTDTPPTHSPHAPRTEPRTRPRLCKEWSLQSARPSCCRPSVGSCGAFLRMQPTCVRWPQCCRHAASQLTTAILPRYAAVDVHRRVL